MADKGVVLEPKHREPTQREQLEYALVSGAASALAISPGNARQVVDGINVVLDTLHPLPTLSNPHTGTPRDPRDVASDPQAVLCVKPGEPLKASTIVLPVVDPGPDSLEREIQANSHHSGCKGERCMASAANGYAHSRECIDEAGEAQGWTPTAEDYAKCGPSAGCCGAAPTDSHASAVLYPAIERAMSELGTLHPAFNFAANRAFNHLHDAFWSECPAPASAAPKRPDFPGV